MLNLPVLPCRACAAVPPVKSLASQLHRHRAPQNAVSKCRTAGCSATFVLQQGSVNTGHTSHYIFFFCRATYYLRTWTNNCLCIYKVSSGLGLSGWRFAM